MLQAIEQLLVLQDRDKRIHTLKAELTNAPLERAALEARLAAANTGAEQVKQQVRDLELQKKKLEIEAQAKRDQIGRFKAQQSQTRKNEEYQALSNEIAHFEKEIQKIEDQELDAMDGIEQLRPVLAQAEQNAMQARSLVAAQIADLEAKGNAIRQNLAQVEAERATLTVGIDEDLLEVYNRLFASKGGNAIVPLEHEVCMGCHMKLTAQTAVLVKGGRQITHCEQCARILYLPY